MKCNQSRLRFELVSPCPFPTTITITPQAPLRTQIQTHICIYIYIYIYVYIYLCIYIYIYIYIYVYIIIIIMPPARISLALSRNFSLSFIASGGSSRLHPVSSHSCCIYVRASHPAFAWLYEGSIGVHHWWVRPCFSSSVLRVLFVYIYKYIYKYIYIYIYIHIYIYIYIYIEVNMMDSDIIASEFDLQSGNHVNFWTNTLGKRMNSLIPSYHDCSCTKIALALNNTQIGYAI